MTADGVARAVRGQLGLGRLLPLGGEREGLWLAERAAAGVLRAAERAAPGARLARVGVALARPEAHDWGAVRAVNPAAPPTGLPVGPLRITAEVVAPDDAPIPLTARLLRAALAGLAADRLGLDVAAVDLAVVDVAGGRTGDRTGDGQAAGPPAPAAPASTGQRSDAHAVDGHAAGEHAAGGQAVDGTGPACDAARRVAGVRSAISRPAPADSGRLHITIDADRRALDVARAVRDTAGVAAVVVVGIATG
jgi:hypothetical protein